MSTDNYKLYSYTRAMAIADGFLVDVSQYARESGFTVPVAVTKGVWEQLASIPEDSGEDITGRLRDLLLLLFITINIQPDRTDEVTFSMILNRPEIKNPMFELYAMSHPGDEGEHVITVMLPGED